MSQEFSTIERYFSAIAADASTSIPLSTGDDCAVLNVPAGMELCVSTDTLLEGVHFPKDASPSLVAERTMAANLSDLAAMGALPFSFVLALTLPEIDDTWLTGFSRQLHRIITRYDVPLVGGNLSRGPMSLTMTVMGTLPAGSAMTRHGGVVGDFVYVTGSLGDAAAGLKQVITGTDEGYLVSRYAAPVPRLLMGQSLRGIATAAIDISDGLVADAGHLAKASGVGMKIWSADLPLSEELVANKGIEVARELALTAGDDYELCFSAPAEREDELRQLAEDLDLSITRIGCLTGSNEVIVADPEGNEMAVTRAGYEHF